MRVRVLHSVAEVEAAAWDELCPDVVFSHGWFRALEESGTGSAEPRHLLLQEGGRIAAILPCFVQRDDPYYDLSDRLFGGLRPVFDRLGIRGLPALLAFSPLAQRSAVFVREGCDRAAALRELTGGMGELCRDEGIALDGWLFADPRDAVLGHVLDASGHGSAFLAPCASWRNEFESFDAWLAGLRRIGRKRQRVIRNELNRAARAGLELAELPLEALDDATLYALHASFYLRKNGVPTPLSPGFFAALKRGLGQRAWVHVVRRDGELLAYSLALKSAASWHLFLSGERDAHAGHADAAHFGLDYYLPMRLAIEQRAPLLHYGLSSYQEKLLRGCTLSPLSLRLRAHTPLARRGLGVWLPLVDARYRWKHRSLPISVRSRVPVTARGGVRRAPLWRRWLNVVFERHDFVITAASTARLAGGPDGGELRLRALEEHELAALGATATRTGRRLFEIFRRAGYSIFGAFAGDRLAGYLWITAGAGHYGPYFGWQPLRPRESFVGFTWVDPELRGRGVSRLLKAHAARVLGERGVRVQYAAVHDGNTDSLKSNARLGALPVRLWHFRRFGPFTWRRVSALPEGHALAGLFAKQRRHAGLPAAEAAALGAPPDPALAARRDVAAHWSPADPLLRQLAGYLRRHGAVALAREAWRRAVRPFWQDLDILECTLDLAGLSLQLPGGTPRGLEIRRIDAEALSLLERVASPAMLRQFRRFMAERFECWGAFVAGELVGYSFFSERPYHSDTMGFTFPLEEDERFLVFGHVLRRWRRRRIDHAIRCVAFADLRRRGVRRLRMVVHTDDPVTLELNLRWGIVPCRLYRFRRRPGRRRFSVVPLVAGAGLPEHSLAGRSLDV